MEAPDRFFKEAMTQGPTLGLCWSGRIAASLALGEVIFSSFPIEKYAIFPLFVK